MSLLKKLFGKDKDKYGKGHRLGDPSTSSRESNHNERPKSEYTRPQNVSEASLAAGQAALARMQQLQQPSIK